MRDAQRGRDGSEVFSEPIPPVDYEYLKTQYLQRLANYINVPISESLPEALGRELAAIALPPGVRRAIAGEILRRTEPGAAIRLIIRTPELQALPWEFIYLDGAPFPSALRGFLGLCPGFHVIRQVESLSPGAPLSVDSLKVLVAWADPRTAAHPALARIEAECNSVLAVFNRPECRHIQADRLHSATPAGLQRRLRDLKPHILHFIGHGEERNSKTILWLESDKGGAENMVSGKDLADWLTDTPVRLVILSACGTLSSTHHIARELARKGVCAVVGMQAPLRDTAVSSLMRAFYSALAEPNSVEEALWNARQAVQNIGPDWAVPTLFLCGDSKVFLPAPPAPLETPFTVPYPDNQDVYGRATTLAQLREALTAKPQRPVSLVGMGGIGKTQLAIRYAYAHRADYPGGVFWINAKEPFSLEDDYAGIGRWFPDNPGSRTVQERILSVRSRLEQSTDPTLLIFDNVMKAEDLRLRPQRADCHILITTREKMVGKQLGKPLVVPDLDTQAALQMLQSHREAADENDLQAARDIAKALGYLPLALALVAVHIALLDVDFTQYRELLLQNPLKALQSARKQFVAATNHDGKVYDALALSYDSIPPPARLLLRVAACFSGRGISQTLLAAAGQSDFTDFPENVGLLENASLIRRERVEEGEELPRLTLHELVRVFALEQMEETERQEIVTRVTQTLADCLRQANEARHWRPVRREIAHAYAALELGRKSENQQSACALLYEMAVTLRANGEFQNAVTHMEEWKQRVEQLYGPRSAQTACALLELGDAKDEAGYYEEALKNLKEGMAIARAVFAPDAPEIIDYHNSIGYALKYMGDRKRAMAHYRKSLQLSKKAYASSPEKVATCLNNLGALYEAERDFDRALRFYRDALSIFTAALGSRDMPAAKCLNNIGRVLTTVGRSQDALARHYEALDVYLAIYGDDHLDVADTHFFMGDALRELGRMDEARRHYNAAFPIYRRSYGIEHPTYRKVLDRLKSVGEHIP